MCKLAEPDVGNDESDLFGGNKGILVRAQDRKGINRKVRLRGSSSQMDEMLWWEWEMKRMWKMMWSLWK